MARIIAHIDLNAFFVTCEQIRDPSLIGKPILIGHEGRSGIVSTCSYEARALGCHSGQPMFQATKLAPNAIIIHGDYQYYQVMSNSFFSYIRRFTKYVEAASIDECYCDFTHIVKQTKDVVTFFHDLQFGLLKEMGLKCSIGVSTSKWMAKMGSDLKKPMGLTFVKRSNLDSTLYPLPIESFWGIGKKTAPELRKMGINTIGDLAEATEKDDAALIRMLGKFYPTVKEWVHGYGSDHIDMTPFDPKSIGNSETLMHDCDSFIEIESTLKSLAKEVSDRAKSQHKAGSTITLTVKDTVEGFHLHTKAVTLEYPTSDFEVIFSSAKELYRTSYEGKFPIRLVGITLSKLVNPARQIVQMNLWNYEEYEESDKTKLLIARLNRKMRTPMLKRARDAKKKEE